ncbi:2-phospho-D-glycerate hydrolase [Tanacetum coccineum]
MLYWQCHLLSHCKPCWKQDLGVACLNIQRDKWRSHAGSKLAMQEFMNLAVGASSFKEAIKMGVQCNLLAAVSTNLDQYPSQKHTLDPVRINGKPKALISQQLLEYNHTIFKDKSEAQNDLDDDL